MLTKFFVLVCSAVAYVEYDNGVIELDDYDFDEVIAQYAESGILVFFYSPTCNACIEFAPNYAKAAQILQYADPPVALAKVNAMANKELRRRFKLPYFPNLKWFKDGEKEPYKSAKRSVSGTLEWVRMKTGTNTEGAEEKAKEAREAATKSIMISCEGLKKMTNDRKINKDWKFALAYFGEESGDLHDSFKETLKDNVRNEKIKFYKVDDAECASEYGANMPGVVLFRNFEEKQVSFSGESAGFVDWIRSLIVPAFYEYEKRDKQNLFLAIKPTLILHQNEKAELSDKRKQKRGYEEYVNYIPVFKEAFEANKDKMYFATSNSMVDMKDLKLFGPYLQEPAMYAYDSASMTKYNYTGSFEGLTADQITQFVDDVIAGTAPPYWYSEPVKPLPEPNSGQPTTVVGENFDEVVMDSSKDVVVFYMTPGKGRYEKAWFLMSELAQQYKDTDLVFAQYDPTLNEAANAFPVTTLKQRLLNVVFHPTDNKEGILLTNIKQNLEEVALMEWIKANATVTLPSIELQAEQLVIEDDDATETQAEAAITQPEAASVTEQEQATEQAVEHDEL